MNLQDDHKHTGEILEATESVALSFLESLSTRPAGCVLQELSHDTLPDEGMGAIAALTMFRDKYEAQLSGSPGPRYLGFVTGGSTPAALAGDWLTAVYDQNLASDGDSVATTVERETLNMLRDLFGIPEQFEGVFVSGATQANLVALATARQWAAQRMGINVTEQGLWGMPPIPVLGGTPHASILKALSILGMGRQSFQYVACLPSRQVVDPQAVAQHLAALEGKPAIVVASAGEVNTGDFDDIEALAEMCKAYGAWLHVDGAFGLYAACDPALEHLLSGFEHADSITTDGHKWLNVPYDSGIVLTRHVALQEEVFRASAAYLGEGSDLLHRTPEDSRRFRALPAWMTLMAYGKAGYRELVGKCCSLAKSMGKGIEQSSHFELLTPVRLNIVCFALRGANNDQRDLFLEKLKEDGQVLLTPTFFGGKPAIRAAFANWSTSERDIPIILDALERCASSLE